MVWINTLKVCFFWILFKTIRASTREKLSSVNGLNILYLISRMLDISSKPISLNRHFLLYDNWSKNQSGTTFRRKKNLRVLDKMSHFYYFSSFFNKYFCLTFFLQYLDDLSVVRHIDFTTSQKLEELHFYTSNRCTLKYHINALIVPKIVYIRNILTGSV